MGGAPEKRKLGYVEFVDLSGDHVPPEFFERHRKSPRPDVPRVRAGESSGVNTGPVVPLLQSQQSTPVDLDDDNAAEEIFDGAQDIDDVFMASQLYGVIHTKIVGVRFYRGHATVGECVRLHREPDNTFDPNAIRIANVMGDTIGHLPREMAAKLAPYIDLNYLTLEATLAGVKTAFDCPLDIKLFGTSDPQQQMILMGKMASDRLPIGVIREDQRERQREQARRWNQEMEQMRAQERTNNGLIERQQNQGPPFPNLSIPGPQNTDIQELMSQSVSFNPREMGNVVERFGVDEKELAKMPMAECPVALSTELLPYQRQGLAWMLEKESPRLPGANSSDVVQLWKRTGSTYTNIATNFATSAPPPLASGGILADDMGLGKTIQVIGLILSGSKPRNPQSSKTTLIVSPLGVMSNWKHQIAQHVKESHDLSVLIYHGSGKKEAKKLDHYDVVITTYGALASEFTQIDEPETQANKLIKPKKGLFSVHWRRVVLDEGHNIRTPRTKGARAACRLDADSRWSLTGTPIVNNLKDLYSQTKFLRISGGLEDYPMFNGTLIRPLNAGDQHASLILQGLMGTFALRRKKDMDFVNLKLPQMSSQILRVQFLAHERQKYNMFLSEAKGVFQEFTSQGEDGRITYSHVLEVLLRLRQVCNHWSLCQNRVRKLVAQLEEQKVVKLTPENIKALQAALQLSIESQESCPICLDGLDRPVITACGHTFDSACIVQVIERQRKCPMCRADLQDFSSLVSPAAELGEDTGTTEIDTETSSSKVDALIRILTAEGQSAGTKTVVFSQWTSYLDLLEPHLARNDIKFTRIDGKMNSAKRDAAMGMLANDSECTVMLASLNVCSVGLNLVAANQVILADSWWAPAIEDQAVDRVYRLGQERETTVWRLVMEESIEERVLEIQERKRELMLTAFRDNAVKKKEARSRTLADLRTLLR